MISEASLRTVLVSWVSDNSERKMGLPPSPLTTSTRYSTPISGADLRGNPGLVTDTIFFFLFGFFVIDGVFE